MNLNNPRGIQFRHRGVPADWGSAKDSGAFSQLSTSDLQTRFGLMSSIEIQVSRGSHLSLDLGVAHIDFIGKISRRSITLASLPKPNSTPAPGIVGISLTM
jgi:hypothetical protein